MNLAYQKILEELLPCKLLLEQLFQPANLRQLPRPLGDLLLERLVRGGGDVLRGRRYRDNQDNLHRQVRALAYRIIINRLI